VKSKTVNFFISSLLFLFFLAGCGEKAPPPEEPKETVKATPPREITEPGTLQGTILFQGEAPAPRKLRTSGNPECSVLIHGDLYSEDLISSNGKLQNAIVFVKEGLEGQSFPTPEEPVLIDQRGCTFVPHVVAVQKDQAIELLNSDATLHNINARAKNSKKFNIAFPVKGMKRNVSISAQEIAIPIRCDLHPWMTGYIAVFDHPYFQVTGPDGKFSFSSIPAGKYEIEVWHEKLGTQSQTVEIAPHTTQDISFTFSL